MSTRLALACLIGAVVGTGPPGVSRADHGTVISNCSVGPFVAAAPGTYTLAADLGPCPGDGVLVTADDVTIDLHGHRLFGSGDSLSMPRSFAGVRIIEARRVQVTSTPAGGEIDSFNAGVVVDSGSSEILIQNLDVHHNIGQLSALAFGTEWGDGVVLRSARRTVVRNNSVHGNGPFSGITVSALTDQVGKVVGASPVENMIYGNRVRDNDVPGLCGVCPPETRLQPHSQEDVGIRLEGPGAQRNLVSRNVVERNGADGILISFVDNSDFPNHRPPHVPLNPENFGNVVSDNVVRDNGFGLPGPGHWFPDLTGNGIHVMSVPFDVPPNIAPSHHNSVRRNLVTGSRGSGIAITPQAHSNQVAANVATGNNVGGIPPTGPFGGGFDLKDANHPTTPPNLAPCNGNVWTANRFGTRSQSLAPSCIS